MNFEIEYRAKFDQKKYDELRAFLDKNAKSLGEDNKDCYYYIFEDKLLKVVSNTSQKTAKISLKLNRIGQGAVFPEMEFYFRPDQFDVARRVFDSLKLPAKVMHGPQERINYSYEECEIALKWSDAWGYHLEIEQVVGDRDKQVAVEIHIHEVAKKLGVHLMDEDELREFTHRAEESAT